MFNNIGIGVSNLILSKSFYKGLGFHTEIITMKNEASYCMKKYRKKSLKRTGVILGGNSYEYGTIELIEPSEYTIGPLIKPKFGDIGIFKIKVQTKNNIKTLIDKNPVLFTVFNSENNILYDPDYNYVEINYNQKCKNNYVYGVTIGVTDINNSINTYTKFGYKLISNSYFENGTNNSIIYEGGNRSMHKAILSYDNYEIELIQIVDKEVNNLYYLRDWGDIGFCHIAFNWNNDRKLDDLKCTIEKTKLKEYNIYFSYYEDPDGILIELIDIKIKNKKLLSGYIYLSSLIPNFSSITNKIPYYNTLKKKKKLLEYKATYKNYFKYIAKGIEIEDYDKLNTKELVGKVYSTMKDKGYITYAYNKDDESKIKVNGENKEIIDLCGCSFSGIRNIPEYKKHVDECIGDYDPIKLPQSFGASGANGNVKIVNEICKEIANFFGKEECIMASSGYLACMSSVQSVCTRDTIILMDEHCHDCLKTGALISKGKIIKFKHNNIFDAFDKVKNLKNKDIVIVVESIYSMDATVFDLPRIRILKKYLQKNNKVLVVSDESHAIGNLGKTGKGGEEYFNIYDTIDIISSTCSKGIATVGGIICANKEIMDIICLRASSYIFTANINGYCARLIQAGFRTLEENGKKQNSNIKNAQRLSKYFKLKMHNNGIRIGHLLNYHNLSISLTPIIINSELKMMKILKRMAEEEKYLLFGAGFPVCKINMALFRISVRGDLNTEILDDFSDVLIKKIKEENCNCITE